jgi:hypothetical protein
MSIFAYWLRQKKRPERAAETSVAERFILERCATKKRSKRRKYLSLLRQHSRWLKLSLCLAPALISIYLYLSHAAVAAAVTLLAGAVLSTIFTHAPLRRQELWFLGSIFLLATTQAFIVVLIAAIGVLYTVSTFAILQLVSFGFVGACVAGVVVAKFCAQKRVAEPAALGIAAVFLILVCGPGIFALIQPLNFPASNGGAVLFVSNTNQDVTLDVYVDDYGTQQSANEMFDISTTSRQRLRWALAVSGQAIIKQITTYGDHIIVRTIKDPSIDSDLLGPGNVVQLFSGYVDYAARASIVGSAGSFTTFSSGRTAVALPFYGISQPGDLIPFVSGSRLVEALDEWLGEYLALPIHSNVNVSFGQLAASDAVVGSVTSPAFAVNRNGYVKWSSELGAPITFTISNTSLSDYRDTELLLLTFLLGVAGAGLFASLQSGIHLYVSSRSVQLQ